jgi:hypothetical protein
MLKNTSLAQKMGQVISMPLSENETSAAGRLAHPAVQSHHNAA